MFRQFFCDPWFLFKQFIVYNKTLIEQNKQQKQNNVCSYNESFKLTR